MLTLRDIMTSDVTTVEPEATLREVAELLSTLRISGVPVVRGRRVLGVVSATDLVEFAAGAPVRPAPPESDEELAAEIDDLIAQAGAGSDRPTSGADEGAGAYFGDLWTEAGGDILERFVEARGAEWNVLEEYTTEEVMTRSLRSLPPDTGIHDAAAYMLENDIHRVLVMDGAELVGVATTTDFLRALAERRL